MNRRHYQPDALIGTASPLGPLFGTSTFSTQTSRVDRTRNAAGIWAKKAHLGFQMILRGMYGVLRSRVLIMQYARYGLLTGPGGRLDRPLESLYKGEHVPPGVLLVLALEYSHPVILSLLLNSPTLYIHSFIHNFLLDFDLDYKFIYTIHNAVQEPSRHLPHGHQCRRRQQWQ